MRTDGRGRRRDVPRRVARRATPAPDRLQAVRAQTSAIARSRAPRPRRFCASRSRCPTIAALLESATSSPSRGRGRRADDRRAGCAAAGGRSQAEIDLHGLGRQAAHVRLREFIADSAERSLRCVRVDPWQGPALGSARSGASSRWSITGCAACAGRCRIRRARPVDGGTGARIRAAARGRPRPRRALTLIPRRRLCFVPCSAISSCSTLGREAPRGKLELRARVASASSCHVNERTATRNCAARARVPALRAAPSVRAPSPGPGLELARTASATGESPRPCSGPLGCRSSAGTRACSASSIVVDAEAAPTPVQHRGFARQQPVPVAALHPRGEHRVEEPAARGGQREAARRALARRRPATRPRARALQVRRRHGQSAADRSSSARRARDACDRARLRLLSPASSRIAMRKRFARCVPARSFRPCGCRLEHAITLAVRIPPSRASGRRRAGRPRTLSGHGAAVLVTAVPTSRDGTPRDAASSRGDPARVGAALLDVQQHVRCPCRRAANPSTSSTSKSSGATRMRPGRWRSPGAAGRCSTHSAGEASLSSRPSSTTAWQASPSPRPIAPSPSHVVALMLMRSDSHPRSSGDVAAHRARDDRRAAGASASSVRSALTTRQPRSRSSDAQWRRNSRLSAPFHRGSLSGKCCPMSPRPMRPEQRIAQRVQQHVAVGMRDHARGRAGCARRPASRDSPGPKACTSKPWPTLMRSSSPRRAGSRPRARDPRAA